MGWSKKYKRSIDCNNPKGFSQKAHCAGRKKRESKMSLKLEELVGKKLTEEQFDEAAGKKDACYYKVKARYDVWPSAYASGALVKCRKVGAKNWGNKSKKEGVYEKNKGKTLYGKDLVNYFVKRFKYSTRDATAVANKLKDVGFKVPKVLPKYEGLDDLKALPKDLKKSIKKNREEGFASDAQRRAAFASGYKAKGKKKKKESVDEARGTCWVGYQQLGMKRKGGKMVPNCVKEITELYYEIDGKGYGYTFEYINDGKLNEAEYQGRKVKLGKIMQGDVKKFKVYVKNPKGNVVKVNFGQGGKSASKTGGTMRIRKSNPKARANFRARHNCDNPGPRHKARYWACRTW